ncbi:hypothetical protein REPUB_Repub03eG0258700 [Reevesia pubescens]
MLRLIRIPDDLVPNILQCLPVNALLRFRCLSKSVCREIDSAAFAKTHLERSLRTKTHRKLVFHDRKKRDMYAIDFDGIEDDRATKLINPLKTRYKFHGTCNGLLLLSNDFYCYHTRYGNSEPRLWLWNPFTRKCKKLPNCLDQAPGSYHGMAFNGFGYDPVGNDYKIVKIFTSFGYGPRYKISVWVFSLAVNTWRKVPIPYCQETFNGIKANGVFADGALHWLSDVSKNHSKEIVTFDISNEVFVKVIPSIPPSSPTEPERFKLSLEVLGGRLALYEAFAEHAELSYAVKNGQNFAWRKFEYNINLNLLNWSDDEEKKDFLQLSDFKLLELSKDGNKILLLTRFKSNFLWYDLKHGTLERAQSLPIGMLNICFSQKASLCWESLVLPGDDTDDEIMGANSRAGQSSDKKGKLDVSKY